MMEREFRECVENTTGELEGLVYINGSEKRLQLGVWAPLRYPHCTSGEGELCGQQTKVGSRIYLHLVGPAGI